MKLENAKKIPGWTSETELEWLAQQASTRKRVVEIGSWKGRSTRAMADNLPAGGVIYAVDTWKGTPEDGHLKELAGKQDDWLIEEFHKNIGEDLIKRDRSAENLMPFHTVRPLDLPSVEAADYLHGYGPFDMIFIDAAHDYENVKADILAWWPLLADGGLLCGHDFDAGRPGVVKAVRELIPNPRMAGAGSIWFAG